MGVTAAKRPVPPAAWLILALSGYATALTATAWMSDDAYITLRTLDHWVNGYGLRFNAAERVQAYTHPLWLLLLAGPYAITGEPYFTTLFVSMNTALAATALIAWFGAEDRRLGAAMALLLLSSKAYMDFSTSGLENPLTHLLLAGWLLAAAGERDSPVRGLWLGAAAGLIVVNRLDLVWMIGPAMVWRLRHAPRGTKAAAAMAGLLPLAAWFGFATLYYGSPIPNTAWAKLGHGIGAGAMIAQGLAYVWDSLSNDPVTFGAVAAATVLAIARRDGLAGAAMGGAWLYIAYVVWAGGDFMSGRFFTAPFFAAVWAIGRCGADFPERTAGAACAAVLAAAVLAYPPPLLTGAHYGRDTSEVVRSAGIIDERAFYYPYTGLLPVRASGDTAVHSYADDGRRLAETETEVITLRAIGMRGYYAGPGVHVIDECALADPLLSRLPADAGVPMRVGHYLRSEPPGYEESIRADDNFLVDPALQAYYTAVRTVTRGPIFAPGRFAAMVRMWRGPLE